MNCTLKRHDYLVDGIFGCLLDDSGDKICVTLEHSFSQPDGSFKPIIQPGTYTVVRRLSPKFGYDIFLITGVVGHTFVEMHVGNVNADSDGCVLLGLQQWGEMIIHSRDAFNKFMALQAGVDSWELTIL